MKLIIIDRKAWERHRSEFADFIHRVEKLIGNPPKTEQWLDNEAVFYIHAVVFISPNLAGLGCRREYRHDKNTAYSGSLDARRNN